MTTLLAGALALSLPSVAHAQDIESPAVNSDPGVGLLAQPGRFGLGVGGSSLASGVTGKLYLSDSIAAQAHAGWWFAAGISLGADLLVERAFVKNEHVSVQAYGGAGPSVGLFSLGTRATVVGVSGVGGLGLHLGMVPVELTVEIRPTLLLGNQAWNGFYFGGGGAARWYF